MGGQIRVYRAAIVLLTAALITSMVVIASGGERADAVEGPVDVVYVASGRNFPDALAGATLAATTGAPLLTVEPGLPLPPTTVTALRSLDPDRIIVLGGPAAVSEEVRAALIGFARSATVTRIQGTDRHETAALIAEALPDKVHDSDLLDGLDSDAFQRSDAPASDANLLGGQPPSSYRVYHLTVNTTSVVTGATSPELEDTVVTRRDGQPTGHFCIDFPDDVALNTRGAVGSPSTTVGSGLSGPTDIVVLAWLNDGCLGDGADMAVRLGNKGVLTDGPFVLLIPGA